MAESSSPAMGKKPDDMDVSIGKDPSTLFGKYVHIALVVTLYWVVSISMVFLNKELLSGTGGIDAPLFITWYQCLVTIALCLGLRALSHTIPDVFQFPALDLNMDILSQVLPLSFIFVCMITFNNLCLKYVDVTFYYISRSLTTIFNVIFSFLILGEKTSKPVMGCCAVIIGGYYMGIDQEHGVGYLSLAGVSYGFLACIFVSLNAIFTKKILPAVDNSVWKLTFYNNVNGAIIFIPLMLLFQEQSVVFNFPNLSSFLFWFLMSITGVCGFAIAYVTILQIQVTSPLTHNISGTAKACAQTVIASVWYHELRPALWWLSNMIVLGGSMAYARLRQLEMRQKATHEPLPSHIKG